MYFYFKIVQMGNANGVPFAARLARSVPTMLMYAGIGMGLGALTSFTMPSEEVRLRIFTETGTSPAASVYTYLQYDQGIARHLNTVQVGLEKMRLQTCPDAATAAKRVKLASLSKKLTFV